MTILFCTTETLLMTSIEFRFRKMGWRLELAPNAETAYKKTIKEAPEVVVVDLQLPEYEGLDIVQKIKRELEPNLPMLVISPIKDKKIIMEGLRLGARDFIVSPYQPEELTFRIHCLIKRKKVV